VAHAGGAPAHLAVAHPYPFILSHKCSKIEQ
jgi:hypothetical protein